VIEVVTTVLLSVGYYLLVQVPVPTSTYYFIATEKKTTVQK
jgi:hypothetical protein